VGILALAWAYADLFAPNSGQNRIWAGTLRFNLVSLGFGLLLPWGHHCQSLGPAFVNAAIRHLACWSYAMYLSHMLVLRFLTDRWLPDFDKHAPAGWLAFALFWIITIGFSALIYHGFERPCTSLRDRFAFSRE
jgi:peptidoglycan/LPS O-acetylase OafA/YrhL